MEFFIADNEPTQLTALKRLLEPAYPGSTIWPPSDTALVSWADVIEKLRVHTADSEGLVVFLDLALEAQSMPSVRAGAEYAFQIRGLRPKSILVAYTQWQEYAESYR